MSGKQSWPVSDLPTKEELYNPILTVFRELGRSATPREIESQVIESLGLPDEVLEELTPAGWPRLRARLDWARFDLKNAGLLDSTQRGVWVLTDMGQGGDEIDPSVILSISEQVMKERKQARQTEDESEGEYPGNEPSGEDFGWRSELRSLLLTMDPSAFERLCQRILRESGFTDVSVTRRSGDGGIDGNGILQLQGIISVPIAFQSKRYKGSVSAPTVREFRGSLGRQAERGLLMTTGTFTQDARHEAKEEGKVFIDLMDGDALLDKLKELKLGVKTEMVEQTAVDESWWESNYGVSM